MSDDKYVTPGQRGNVDHKIGPPLLPGQVKQFTWGEVVAVILFVAFLVFMFSTGRADSTFVPLDPPKPTVCHKVCPVCGHCRPICHDHVWFNSDSTSSVGQDRGDDSCFVWECRTNWGREDDKAIFGVCNCDSIIWGRWRQICRVDTVGKRLVGGPPDEPYALWWQRLDTIYVDDLRCDLISQGLEMSGSLQSYITVDTNVWQRKRKDTIHVVPARGLDSVYTLPHDTTIDYGGSFGPIKTQVPGHWVYFDWKNGKRANLRSKP